MLGDVCYFAQQPPEAKSEYVSNSPLLVNPHTSYMAACMASCVCWHALENNQALLQNLSLTSVSHVA